MPPSLSSLYELLCSYGSKDPLIKPYFSPLQSLTVPSGTHGSSSANSLLSFIPNMKKDMFILFSESFYFFFWQKPGFFPENTSISPKLSSKAPSDQRCILFYASPTTDPMSRKWMLFSLLLSDLHSSLLNNKNDICNKKCMLCSISLFLAHSS
jgi:hypothetical protein